MKHFISVVFIFFTLHTANYAQNFSKLFSNSSTENFKTLGGPTLTKMHDGNFLILCDDVHGSSFWVAPGSAGLLKIDPNGNVLLQKNLEESVGLGARITPTADNGYIITGFDASMGNSGIIKLNSNLDIVWKKGIGGSDYYYNRIIAVKETSDNNLIAVGTTGSYSNGQASVFLVKFSQQGNFIWGKSFGYGGDEDGMDVLEDDGNFYVLGYGSGYLGYTVSHLFKVGSNGNLLFAKAIKGSWAGNTRSFLKKHDNSGFILAINNAAHDYSNNTTPGDVVIIDMDKNAAVNWAKKYDTGEREEVCNLNYTSNGYILSGWRQSIEETSEFTRTSQLFLMKFDEAGNAAWFKTYLDTSAYICTADIPLFCMESSNDGYLLVNSVCYKTNTELGYNGAMLLLRKTNSNGDIGSCPTSYTVNSSNETITITDLTATTDIISGGTITNETASFVTFNTYNSETVCYSTAITEQSNALVNVEVFPNPFNDYTSLRVPVELGKNGFTLKVFDSMGKEVYKDENITETTFMFKKENLNSGIYYYKLYDAGNHSYSGKLLINN